MGMGYAEQVAQATGWVEGPHVKALNLNPPFWDHPVPEGAKPTTVPMRYMPRLSLAERDRRWDALRKRMLMSNVDALLFLGNDIYWDMGLANIRYVTNAASKIATHALFLMDRDPIVYNNVGHMNRPYNYLLSVQDWVTDIRPFRGLAEITAELKDLSYGRSRIGLVGFNSTIQTTTTFLKGEVEFVERSLPEAELTDFSGTLQQMRVIKSEEEIGLMRRAAAISRNVIDVLVQSARPGKTEAEVFADMIRSQIAQGGEPNVFNLFASGPVEHSPEELWHLQHGLDQPYFPSTRPLAEGDLIVTEWHTKYGGYLVHTEYTAYVGPKIPQQLQDIFKVCVECLDVSKEVLKAGTTLREAWEAIRKPCAKAGYDFVELGFHAMGLGSPEFPTVIYHPGYGGNALNGHRIGDLVLEEGMCFGNNIDIFDPAWKCDVGCMFSDFMVVRPGGAELLVNTPREIGHAWG